jgi:hypothetical protein
MKTVFKMLAVIFGSVALIVWYLDGHPRPLSRADSTLLIASAITSVWIAYLVWKIDSLKDEIEELQTTEVGLVSHLIRTNFH